MLEPDLRKIHRTFGIIFALFIIMQATGGIILSVYDLFEDQEKSEQAQSTASPDTRQNIEPEHPLWIRLVHEGHAGGGIPSDIYRIILGVGLIYVAVTGSMIYFKIRARQKGRSG